jgi:diaminopimelate epimerase
VDCGNPHLVCPVPDISGLDLRDPPGYDAGLFPSGVNVEFMAPGGAALHVRMRVHERGSGETLSCGSGALAVGAVALRDAGVASGEVTVDVPGGRLTVTHEGDDWWLAGPAVLVATGEVDVAALG